MTPALNRKAVPSSSPGLRRGYPGITNENDHPTARWLRHFFCRVKKRRNRVAVETSNQSLPRVPEAANPGLEAVTALRFGTKQNRSSQFLGFTSLFDRDGVTSSYGCN